MLILVCVLKLCDVVVDEFCSSAAAWNPNPINGNEYLQVDLGSIMLLTGVATQVHVQWTVFSLCVCVCVCVCMWVCMCVCVCAKY